MSRPFLLFFLFGTTVQFHGQADLLFPIVPDDVEVSLFAQEPLVRNPCALAFDARGRLCVGMGPQYRNPTPSTPGDSVVILSDEDGDGLAETSKLFATGLNCIQGLAWKGRDLWIANSPDLTIARDLDGDDEADEYVRVYTDLGNLEHALHGLNWGPDGRLYMSKGNSKGLTSGPDRVAPKPFRELWGVDATDLPDCQPPVVFKKGEYRRTYHHPADDWGREGGVLSCDNDGGDLQIVARGFRNPWDIAFDDEFTWLGTDNDQTLGDKIFSPFYGAHFGWGHPWSFDWKGDDHLPTVPASGPLFEGSGAGVIFCSLERYPERYRGVFLISDWLRRQVYIFRPKWNGAHLVSQDERFDLLATAGGGRSMERSEGRKFDPVDLEIGPDQAIYVSSWGREYGAAYRGGELANEGRIYRLWPREAPPVRWSTSKRAKLIIEWSIAELIEDLASHLPVWRANAQEELIRRGEAQELEVVLGGRSVSRSLETWTAWTLGRMKDPTLDPLFVRSAGSEVTSLNLRIQSLRILAFRGKLPEVLRGLLHHQEPRLRFESLLAIRRTGARDWVDDVLELTAGEKDRLVYYAAWTALRDILSPAERRALLGDRRAGVRCAAVLGLLEEDGLTAGELLGLRRDPDPTTAALAARRLQGKDTVEIRGRPLPTRKPAPETGAVSLSAVVTQLRRADKARGRDLFLSERGAGCAACHRLEGVGNVHAPDLNDIATRADAESIIRSILDPDASITEGFTQQIFTTSDGAVYSGIILEETGASFKLALPEGQTLTLPRTRIQRRETSERSAMPSNYGELLTAQQIANLVAYLRDRADTPPATPAAPAVFGVKRREGEMQIHLGNVAVATYLYRHPHLSRPALVNIHTPSGRRVTREFPAGEGTDHRWLHPGIAVSFGDLDGNDYWRLKAPVSHAGFTDEPSAQGDTLHFAVRNQFLAEGGRDVVCEEQSRYRMTVTPDGVLFQIESELWNDQRDFYLGSQEENGLAIRMTPSLSVKEGGSITNDRGATDEAGTWGHEFRWIDYSGMHGDQRVGVLIVPDPANPRPCWSHSRDYGVIVANPLPRQPEALRQQALKTWIRKGERYRLRYSVLAYETPTGNQPAENP